MTVTVPKIRSAAAMDVDVSVCLHIKVSVIRAACFVSFIIFWG